MHDSETFGVPLSENGRKAIYIDLTQTAAPILDSECFSGWTFQKVTTLEAADAVLQRNPYMVGLACFDWPVDGSQHQLVQFFQRHQEIAWIALIRPESLRDIGLRRLLFENFYDYCSLPLDNSMEHLAVIMGHAYGLYHLQHLEPPPTEQDSQFQMVGASPKMLEIFDLIRKVAQT
ncbi:MAG: VpsR-related response regulator, partial [Marinobacterium sp.]